MDFSTTIILSTVIMLAAFIQGTVGVGFALIVAPVFTLLQPGLIPAALLIIMLPLNLYVAAREIGQLDWPGLGWISLGRLAGGFMGAGILIVVSAATLNILVGLSTILAAAVSLAAPSFVPGRKSMAAAGLITGITETATGIGGPPLALVYQYHPGPVLRSTIAACFFIGQLMSLAILAAGGQIGAGLVIDAVKLVPATVAGAVLSRVAHKRVGGKSLRAAVMVFALAAGMFLLLRELF